MEKQKFEQEWKDAFDQAEVSPSDNLWTNIELNLEKADATKMKSRLLFYKLMAAASIFFAVCMAGAFAYYYNTLTTNDNGQFIADRTQPEFNGHKSESTPGQSELNRNRSGNQSSISQKNQTIATTSTTPATGNTRKNSGIDNRKAADVTGTSISEDRTAMHPNNSIIQHNHDITRRARNQSTNAVVRSVGEDVMPPVTSDNHDAVDHINTEPRDISNQDQKNIASAHNNVAYKPVVTNNTDRSNGFEGVTGNEHGDEKAEVPIQVTLNERNLPSLTSTKKITIKWPEQDPVAVMMARLAQRERELSGEDEKKHKPKKTTNEERLWTSLGMAAGAFNNVNQTTAGVNNNNTFASNNVTANQSKASGTAYSVGMNVGTRLSSRWVLQGGVNYLAQNSSYEANSVVGSADNSTFQAASINSFSSRNAAAQANKLVATVPYSVDNSVRFVSVPVQAGYMVINRALGVQLNGGLSTDLFLQNTLTPQSNSLPTITQNSGENSPYRTVNFSGLVGTELSYRFSRRYRLALNPGLRYPFNSIYKSDVGVKSSPLTFDVGLRFRYIFR